MMISSTPCDIHIWLHEEEYRRRCRGGRRRCSNFLPVLITNPCTALADAAANNPFLLLLLVFSLTLYSRALRRSNFIGFVRLAARALWSSNLEGSRYTETWTKREPHKMPSASASDTKWECGSAKCLSYSVLSRAVAKVSRGLVQNFSGAPSVVISLKYKSEA